MESSKRSFGLSRLKPPWGNLMSINLNTGETNWKVPFGEYESLSKQGIQLLEQLILGE